MNVNDRKSLTLLLKLNLTILSLLSSSFNSSPFISGSKAFSISLFNSALSRFSSSAFYNIKNLHINQVKFNYFKNSPIIYTENDVTDEIDFIYYQFSLVNVYNETLSIDRTLFFHCQSQSYGGGICYINKNGLLNIYNSFFQNCLSYMRGGGAFCKCSEILLDSNIFILCNAVNSQAGYFQASVYSDTNRILIYNCFISGEVTYMGPIIDIVNDYDGSYYSPNINSINASYNTIRCDYLAPLISVKCSGLDFFSSCFMYFFTIFENTCPSEIECFGTDYITIYAESFNMIQNHLSRSVFVISGENYLMASNCVIGNDYDTFYFPKQTPHPTESPFPTFIPPTAPNFTLNMQYGRRIQDNKEAQNYEFVFNRDKKEFEKVYFVPEKEVEKFVNEIMNDFDDFDDDDEFENKRININRKSGIYNIKGQKLNDDFSSIKLSNENAELLDDKADFDQNKNVMKKKKKKNKKINIMNRYAYQPKQKNNYYHDDGFHTSSFMNKDTDNRMFSRETKDIVIALFPDNTGSIVFFDCQIDYPEIENVECDQCYISDLEPNEIDLQTLYVVDIEIESETPEFQESIKMKFPNDAMNIVLICIIIAITIVLYAVSMSILCMRLRLRNEDNINENTL